MVARCKAYRHRSGVILAFTVALGLTCTPLGPCCAIGSVSGQNHVGPAYGFVSASTSQSVSGTSYPVNYCPAQKLLGEPCSAPSGIVYVPPEQVMVLTESNLNSIGGGGNVNAIVEFKPSNLQVLSDTPLGCVPSSPLYPGTGSYVFVACRTYPGDTSSMLKFDTTTGQIVGNGSVPGWILAMSYDPGNGLIYGGGLNSTSASTTNLLVSFDPTSMSAVGATRVANVSFRTLGVDDPYVMVYDPLTNRLIVPNGNASLVAVDPLTDSSSTVATFASPLVSLALDSATGELVVSDQGSPGLWVLNGSTYTVEDGLDVPSIMPGGNDVVFQLVFDPNHGDAYLLTPSGLAVLNLSGLSFVGTVANYYAGYTPNGAYFPQNDTLFGTSGLSWDTADGSGIALEHRTTSLPAEFFGLPVSDVVLIVAVLAGVVIGVLALLWTRPRHPEYSL